MRLAIITDTHYGARKGSKLLHDYFEQFYKNIFFPSLEAEGIDTIIPVSYTHLTLPTKRIV